MINRLTIYFRDAPLRRRVDHFSNSLEVGETRMEPAVEDNLVSLSTSRKRVEQKKRRVKRRRHKHIVREMRGGKSEKEGREKPPRPAGLPPHMVKKLK